MIKNLCKITIAFVLIMFTYVAQAQNTLLSQNNSTDLLWRSTATCSNGDPAINTSENHYYRAFKPSDYIACDSFIVDTVFFGVSRAYNPNGTGTPIIVNLYKLNGTVLNTANLILLNTISGTINNYDTVIIKANIIDPVAVSGNTTIVAEIMSPDGSFDGHYFYMGINDAGETAPSYFKAPQCNFNDIITFPSIGISEFTNDNIVLLLSGAAIVNTPGNFINPVNPVCEAATVSYSVPNVTGMNYTWSYSGTGVTINSSGNQASLTFASGATPGTLSVTADNGLMTSPPRTLAINITPMPTPEISREGDVLSTTSSFTSYQWYRNNIAITEATSETYTLTQNGSYFVKVSSGSCSNISDTVLIDDVNPNAIDDISMSNKIKVYPNPAKDIIHIDSPIPVNISIVTLSGKILLSENKAKIINIETLSPGIYFINVASLDGNIIIREKVTKLK